MLHSSYNVNRLGSPTAGDLINTSVFDTAGGNANYFGASTPFNACGAANCTASMYPSGHTMAQMPAPRRRYSLGALPSASVTEYLNLMHQNADIAHVNNLLNEAKTSITRSSQILCRGENLTDDILMSSAAGDVLAEIQRLNETSDADITGANILNQMRLGYSSQPNIYYAQPNYTQSHLPTDLYMSRLKRSPFDRTAANYTAMYAKPPLANPILTAYTNPYFAGLHTNASHLTSTIPNPLTYTSYQPQSYQTYHTKVYNQPPPPYSSVLFPSTQLHQPSLSATNYHHPHHHYHHQHYPHRPIHHTSNPVISQSSTSAYYTKHLHPSNDTHSMHAHNMSNPTCSGSLAMPSTAGGIAHTSTSASYLHHQNQHPYCGYSNQHFDMHNLNSNNCYPKIDLVDYTKQGEHTKRQVSFNVDVDTLSITS